MPETVQAVVVLFVVVLPGALYTWAFEREQGHWGIGLSDRLLRFIGVSVVFQLLFAAPLYLSDSVYAHHRILLGGSDYIEGLLRAEDAQRIYAVAVTYVGIPIVAGIAAAAAVRSERPWLTTLARAVVGRDPAPRGWDFVFSPRPAALIRGRLRETRVWVGGLFGADSYASGYPEEPQDIYLEAAYRMSENGEFEKDANDQPIPVGSGLLVRWSELESIEIFILET
jgi:hypothetical protein